MVDLILQVILCGFATYFVIELLTLMLEMFATKATIYAVFSMPVSFGFLFSILTLDKTFIVLVPATAFIATALNKWLTKPIQIQQRLPRL